MKIARLLLLLNVCLGGAALRGADEAWVRQTDLDSGLVYDMPVGGTTGGAYTAPLPVTDRGARFELFARGTAWDTKIYLLDTKLIRAYSPKVTLKIVSEDSYVRGDPASSTYVRRTRADRPFNLNVHVEGLVASSTVLAERAVYFSIHSRNYNLETYSGLNQPQVLRHEYNLANGDMALGPVYHELGTQALTAGCGEQFYTIVRYAADSVPDTILAQPKIEVWPVAKASIDKVTAGQVFIDRIPALVLTLKHLYPDSKTYAQIYGGPAVLGTQGTIIGGTERRYGKFFNPDQVEEPTNVPQDLAIGIDDLSKYASSDGIYTLEVITRTPYFNREPERLLCITFEVDRVISSRGQLSTAERTSP